VVCGAKSLPEKSHANLYLPDISSTVSEVGRGMHTCILYSGAAQLYRISYWSAQVPGATGSTLEVRWI
jgi:hypothetical protein